VIVIVDTLPKPDRIAQIKARVLAGGGL